MAHVTVRVRKDGTKSYRVKWRDPNGVFRERTFPERKDADDHVIFIKADLKRGEYIDDRMARMTFREVADEWLLTRTDLKPRTEAEYRRILDSRILPRFGNRQIGSLKKVDSTTFIRSLAADGLSANTIARVYGQYKSVMLHALDEGYISNPNVISKKVKVPTDAKLGRAAFKPRFLSVAELDRLADAAAVFHPDYGLLVRFLGTTGLRVGECAALTVGDLRLYLDGRAEVHVSKTAQKVRGGGTVASSPKTESSARAVTLPPSLASLMRAYLDRHPAKADDSSPAPPSAPLWCGRVPGGHYSADWSTEYRTTMAGMTEEQTAQWLAEDPMRKHWAVVPGVRPLDGARAWDPGVFYKSLWGRIVGIAGLAPLRMHDARHTAASLMLASGMSMLEVSQQLGHADSSITAKVYAHVLPTEVVRSSERYDTWLAAERERADADAANVVQLGPR